MAEASKIEWCDSTFNPWEGCTKVGPGCDHCYAENRNARFGGGKATNWGPGAPRRRTSAANWRKPLQWNARPFYECESCGWRGDNPQGLTFGSHHYPACKDCGQVGLRPTRRRVFCASLADWLDNEVPIEWLVDLLDLIRRTSNLDWLLLTKRIGNWNRRLDDAWTFARGDFREARQIGAESFIAAWQHGNHPPNVWLGATVVNQHEADRDVLKLLAVPARVRFLSIEPMLSGITLDYTWLYPANDEWPRQGNGSLISWVICGGESGPKARPMHPDWVRSLRDQCAAAGVPFLFKQHGEWIATEFASDEQSDIPAPVAYVLRDGSLVSGEEIDFFGGDEQVARIGKKAAGRQIDGRTHDGFPASVNEVPQT